MAITKSGLHEVVYGKPQCRKWHQVGTSFEPIPHIPLPPVQSELPWFWFPYRFRLRSSLTIQAVACACVFASVLLFVSLYRVNLGAAIASLILLNVLFSIPLFYVSHVMNWNFRLREGICYVLGKAAQAREAFKTHPRQPKHRYFAWPISHGIQLTVLNDGTTELWNTSGGELGQSVNVALGQAGFVVQVGNKDMVVPDLSVSGEKTPVLNAEAQMHTPGTTADITEDYNV